MCVVIMIVDVVERTCPPKIKNWEIGKLKQLNSEGTCVRFGESVSLCAQAWTKSECLQTLASVH